MEIVKHFLVKVTLDLPSEEVTSGAGNEMKGKIKTLRIR